MILLFPIAIVAVQAKALTAEFPPTPLPKALAILSKASGLRLAAAPALSNEVLLAHLTEAPIEKTLNHIAESMCAKWKRIDATEWLEPDPEAESRMAQVKAKEEETHLLNSLAYLRKRLGQEPELLDQKAVAAYLAKKEAQEKQRKLAEEKEDYDHMFLPSTADEESPAWRALARIMLQMDPKDLLAMPNDDREVWAELPTPMQHPFSDEAQHILKQYRQEAALIDSSQFAKRVKLIVNKWEQGSALNVRLEAEDISGKRLDSATARMNDDSERMLIPLSQRDRFEPKPGELPIDPPIDVQEVRKALSSFYKGPDKPATLEKWKPTLLDPVRFEPTQWHHGEDLVLAAKGAGKNLVGTVCDLTGSYFWNIEHLTPSQLFSKGAEDFLPTSDGWLVVRSHEWRERNSRTNARSLIVRSVQNGGISVDAAAAWASQTTERWPFTSWIGDYLHVLLTGSGPYSALSTTIDDNALRLWASLGTSTIDVLKNGGTVKLSALSEDAKAKMARIVYWYEGLDDNNADPTEKIPTGISDGTLTMSVVETPVFFGWSSSGQPPANPMPIDAKQFGKYLAGGNSYWEIPAVTYRQYDRFKLGVNRAFTLHFLLNPGAVPMTIRLAETLFDPNTDVVSQLPPDIKAAAEKARLAAVTIPPTPPDHIAIPPR